MFRLKDCGVMLEPQLGMTMHELMKAARKTKELGFGYLFRSDHLLPTDNRRGIDSVECWTSLGAVAAATSAVKFGPMVTPIGFRNPALLAKMACTLHSYSRGRLQFAVGAGWYEPEYRAYGYPFPDYDARIEQFGEALDVMVPLLREGKVDFDGKHFTAHTDSLPRPYGHVNLIIGAKSPSLVRTAARRADEWNIFVASDKDYNHLRSAFDKSLDGRSVTISETGPFMVGGSQSELEKNAKLHSKKTGTGLSPSEVLKRIKARNSPCGLVDEFVDKLRKKADLGIQRYYFQTLTPENSAMLELLADTLGKA